jgi:hypothetical protein
VGLQPYPVKKKIVEKPPRNSAGFCGGGNGLSWAVEPKKQERIKLMKFIYMKSKLMRVLRLSLLCCIKSRS